MVVLTPELVAAYSLCPRKAFLMLRGDQTDHLHEYVNVIDRIAAQTRDRFIGSFDDAEVHGFGQPGHDWNAASAIIDAAVAAGDLAAHIQVLLRRGTGRSTAKGEFEPHVFIGTHSVSGEDKLRLAFMGKSVCGGQYKAVFSRRRRNTGWQFSARRPRSHRFAIEPDHRCAAIMDCRPA